MGRPVTDDRRNGPVPGIWPTRKGSSGKLLGHCGGHWWGAGHFLFGDSSDDQSDFR